MKIRPQALGKDRLIMTADEEEALLYALEKSESLLGTSSVTQPLRELRVLLAARMAEQSCGHSLTSGWYEHSPAGPWTKEGYTVEYDAGSDLFMLTDRDGEPLPSAGEGFEYATGAMRYADER